MRVVLGVGAREQWLMMFGTHGEEWSREEVNGSACAGCTASLAMVRQLHREGWLVAQRGG